MIVELTTDDLRWSFRDKESDPWFLLGQHDRVHVDPTPAYAHRLDPIEPTLRLVQERSQGIPDIDVTFYVAHYEALARSNAFAASICMGYNDDDEEWTYGPAIFMAGKRIQPHPAMTRHLVAHEYGHHVQYAIEAQLETQNILEDYGRLRGIDVPAYYGPGTWHRHPGEVFADDFRILICDIEEEYWPHPGVSYPLWQSDVGQWWETIITADDPEEWKLP